MALRSLPQTRYSYAAEKNQATSRLPDLSMFGSFENPRTVLPAVNTWMISGSPLERSHEGGMARRATGRAAHGIRKHFSVVAREMMTTIVQTNRELGKGKPVQLQARFSERKTATFPLARVSSLQEQKFKLVVTCRRARCLLTAMSCSLHSLPRWGACMPCRRHCRAWWSGCRIALHPGLDGWPESTADSSTQSLANDSLLLAKAALRRFPGRRQLGLMWSST